MTKKDIIEDVRFLDDGVTNAKTAGTIRKIKCNKNVNIT